MSKKYISFHIAGFPVVIYLAMNKTIRWEFRRLFLKPTSVSTVQIIPVLPYGGGAGPNFRDRN
jgi:hypothetical protein